MEKPIISQPADNDEMSTEYANNTMFEPSIWDLKLIFGEYNGRSKSVEYHTAITVPWAHAKLILFYLQANIAAHEVVSGKIRIPPEAIPPEWTPPTPEQAKDPNTEKIYEVLSAIRAKFLSSSLD